MTQPQWLRRKIAEMTEAQWQKWVAEFYRYPEPHPCSDCGRQIIEVEMGYPMLRGLVIRLEEHFEGNKKYSEGWGWLDTYDMGGTHRLHRCAL